MFGLEACSRALRASRSRASRVAWPSRAVAVHWRSWRSRSSPSRWASSPAAAVALRLSEAAALSMADLPRWVVTGRVDSAAMFGAFLQHLHEIPVGRERDALLSLPAVDHRARGFWGEVATPVQPSANPTVLCQIAHCVRCSEGRGGYVFRWFKTEWSRNYGRGARRGSWRPGE